MFPLTFTRVPDTRLYLDGSRWSGILVRDEDASLPDTLDVATALNDYPDAVFVLLSEELAQSVSAQTVASTWIAAALRSGREETRIAWIADPMSSKAYLRNRVDMVADGSGGWILVDYAQTIGMRNLSLILSGQSRVSASASALAFAPPAGFPHRLAFRDGRAGQRSTSFELDGAIGLALLDEALPGGGFEIATFEVMASAAEVLEPAIRFFIPNTDARFPNQALALVHPLLEIPATDAALFELGARLDAWALDDPTRTHFPISAAKPLATWFRSAIGEPVLLTPRDDARLVLAVDPLLTPDAPTAIESPVYFTAQNSFLLTVGGLSSTAAAVQGQRMDQVLVAGGEAIEFFGLAAEPTVVDFYPGQPAWAPLLEGSTTGQGAAPRFDTLTREGGLTSWAVVRGQDGAPASYHSQPRSNALFSASGEAGDLFLEFSAPASGSIATGAAYFPLAPVAGVPAEQLDNALTLGKQILASTRREKIARTAPPPAARTASEPTSMTTIQGFLVSTVGDEWLTLDIAQSLPGMAAPTRMLNIGDTLVRALQTDQLFLAISDLSRFLNRKTESPHYPPRPLNDQGCDLDYRLDSELQFQTLENLDAVPAELVQALRENLVDQAWPVTGEDRFFEVLLDALTPAGLEDQLRTYGDRIADVAVIFGLSAAGWNFDLSPYAWATGGTVLLFKFVPQRLDELVWNISSWTLPEAFNASSTDVQDDLKELIEQARRDESLAELRAIVEDPSWTGVLALNVLTPLAGLPDELKGLAAGIDPSEFRASYIAVDVTPVDSSSGELVAEPSSVGALIDYEAPEPPASGDASPWDYGVLSLRVVIDRSEVAEFGSAVALFSNEWFGDNASLDGADFMSLTGYYQRQNGQDTYIFVNTDDEHYTVSSPVLSGLLTDRVQFYTLAQKQGVADTVNVHTRFVIEGMMEFAQLPIDLFSFGPSESSDSSGLRVQGIALDMQFNITLPSQKLISFDASTLVPNADASRPRPGSLYANFPTALSSIQSGDAQNRPDKNGFMPVEVELTSDGLREVWYALSYDLDLGGPGALVGPLGFTATLDVAWSPSSGGTSQSTPRIFLGLALPGVEGGERSISLEGVIKLLFGTVGLVVGGEGERTSYVLQLRRIALKILSLSIPAAATVDFFLFGDPSGKDRQTVGWYAAYDTGRSDASTSAAPLARALGRSNRLPRALLERDEP